MKITLYCVEQSLFKILITTFLLLQLVANTLLSDTFYVVNTNSSGTGSLCQAFEDANNNPGFDTILFNINGQPPFIIKLTNALPELLEPVFIDGTSQPGYSNSPVIEIDGTLINTNANGITILGGNSIISGLSIYGFKGSGIYLSGYSNNIIENNYIGTDSSGKNPKGNSESGILIVDSSYNIIGGLKPSALNLISGSNLHGIFIYGSNAVANSIIGNLIGTDITGTNILGNAQYGIVLWQSSSNIIGSTNINGKNVISGNGMSGILLIGTQPKYNQIIGNYIGTDITGRFALGNLQDGIYISNGADNKIGDTNAGAGNVISGNRINGITINNPNAVRNIIVGNLIGVDVSGLKSIPNGANGIALNGTSNIVGSSQLKPANVISGNSLNGIYITGTNTGFNLIIGNYIGLDITGKQNLKNSVSGILVENAPNNIIGGYLYSEGNIISGHINGNGIFIRGQYSSNNIVQGNLIGIDITGTNKFPNGSGIGISNAPINIIGGNLPSLRNILSGNFYNGIYIEGQFAAGNVIQGNYIGTDLSGNLSVSNNLEGIYISGSSSNIIGGALTGCGNVISGNNWGGITLDKSTAGTIIQGNIIGLNATASGFLGNRLHNIDVSGGSSYTLIGGTNKGAGNIIAGTVASGYDGVRIRDGSVGIRIQGNSIFGNAGLGIDLGTDGVTPNDTGDNDSGANNLQNFPSLTAINGNYKITITGNLNSLPNQIYTIDFYWNIDGGDPAGYGEGQFYIGSTNVKTDASGNVNFTCIFTNIIPVTGYISATATDSMGNTSEFSANYNLSLSSLVDTDNDGLPNDYEIAFGLNPFNAADAQADSDGDGKSNLKEFQAGTHPKNSLDYFLPVIKKIDLANSILTLQFNSLSGNFYNVYYANRVTGPWTAFATNIIGNGRTISLELPAAQNLRFYKVTIQR